jgi:hypothetical protein
VIVVDDAAVVAAMRLLWEVLKQVVEPSSATVLAAVLAQPQRFAGLRVGLVLSGGNVDIDAPPGAGMSRAARGAGIAAVCAAVAAAGDLAAGVTAWIVWVGERDQARRPTPSSCSARRPMTPSRRRCSKNASATPGPVRGYARLLIFTGGYGTGARFSESQVARRYALKHGVPDDAILIETRSRNTVQNLVEAKRLMDQHGLHRVIVVSDPLHMARALRLSKRWASRYGLVHAEHAFPQLPHQLAFLVQEVYFFHRDLYDRLAEHL